MRNLVSVFKEAFLRKRRNSTISLGTSAIDARLNNIEFKHKAVVHSLECALKVAQNELDRFVECEECGCVVKAYNDNVLDKVVDQRVVDGRGIAICLTEDYIRTRYVCKMCRIGLGEEENDA